MNMTDPISIAKVLDRDGWCYLPAFSGSHDEILRHLGRVIPNRRNGADFLDLIPYATAAAPRKSMSSIVGLAEQPMHTDRAHSPYPPRFVVLQCLDSGEEACPTLIGRANETAIFSQRARFLTYIQWVFHDGVNAPFYAPIAERSDGRMRLRFDPYCMRSASFAKADVAAAESFIKANSERSIIQWSSGSLLIIDNWQSLHARGPGSEKALSRRLRRWYIGEQHGLGM
jgi:Taurine catabolism dioxygenase TauD, TfdA family